MMRNETMKRYILPLLAALFLSGCESATDAQFKTQRSAQYPTVVAKLSDGREVKRIVVVNAGAHDHYVYFIDRADVTNNQAVSAGKTTRNQVTSSFEGYQQ